MKITKKYLKVLQFAWSKIMEACKKARCITEFKVADKFLADCIEEIDIVDDSDENKNQLNLIF